MAAFDGGRITSDAGAILLRATLLGATDRVIGKAEWLPGPDQKANPRFVVTSLTPAEAPARWLYETVY